MQHLTLEEAKAAARKAYDEGKLTAQHADPRHRKCLYSFEGHGCAIGVGLSPETLSIIAADEFANTMQVRKLVGREFLTTDNVPMLGTIQQAHDDWCNSSRCGEKLTTEKCRTRFLRLIDHPSVSE